MLRAILGMGLVLVLTSAGWGVAASRFTDGADGWGVDGDAQGQGGQATFVAEGGNPNGYISGTDDEQGAVWYFVAPPKFLGNQLSAYGTNLTFDLRQSSTDNQRDAVDVFLRGEDLELRFDTSINPGTDWTSYSVPLSAGQGWTVTDAGDATAEQIQTVLSSLDSLRIRGEFISGPDTGDMDNVVLVPEPASLLCLLGGSIVLWRRRRTAAAV